MPERRRPVTPERFAGGFTYADYIAQVQVNKERFDRTYAEAQLSKEDAELFAHLPQRLGGPIKVLALAEDW